jgi:hypothetical protein
MQRKPINEILEGAAQRPWKADLDGGMVESQQPIPLRDEHDHVCDFRTDGFGRFDTDTMLLIEIMGNTWERMHKVVEFVAQHHEMPHLYPEMHQLARSLLLEIEGES